MKTDFSTRAGGGGVCHILENPGGGGGVLCGRGMDIVWNLTLED